VNGAIKILIFSDSHGKSTLMNKAILIEKPDLLLHLGDGIFDMHKVQTEFTGVAAAAVKGNCDIAVNEPEKRTLNLDGIKIYMTHGHIYGVKSGYDTLIEAAKKEGADILLFGHTHVPFYEMKGALHILNPGSLFNGSYGLIEIIKGEIHCRLKSK
jgi:putative phosphoesterase